MNKVGLIYKAVSPSKNVYIGKTTKTLLERKDRHYSNARTINCKEYDFAICRAIRQHGDNIVWSILHFNIPESDLSKLEIEEINNHNSFHSGYNETKGGEGISGWKHTKETRKKISEANKGKIVPAKTREKISKFRKGKHHTKETREKISEANKGKKHSIAARKKISNATKGENHPRAKLTYEIVKEIRIKYATKKYTYKKLAQKYNVDLSTISRIINNLSWVE